jgi:hypothetical protein
LSASASLERSSQEDLLTKTYFARAPARNKYRFRKSSFRAADVASKFITGRPSAAEYTAAADLRVHAPS